RGGPSAHCERVPNEQQRAKVPRGRRRPPVASRRMPRIPRSYLPPVGTYHVTILGVNSTPIVRDDRDRLFLLGLLAREIVERRWRVLAWCLLDTRLHFIVEGVLTSLSAGMQRMNGTHARAFNRRH